MDANSGLMKVVSCAPVRCALILRHPRKFLADKKSSMSQSIKVLHAVVCGIQAGCQKANVCVMIRLDSLYKSSKVHLR
jgi:hypothetical protein